MMYTIGTSKSYDAAEKWVIAALKKAGKEPKDLLLPNLEPNDHLACEVHETIAEWYMSGTTALDAGVVDPRESELRKSPPQECLVKARGWMRRYIDTVRMAPPHRLSWLPEKWGVHLAGVRANAKEVKTTKSGDPLTYLGRHFGTRLLQH